MSTKYFTALPTDGTAPPSGVPMFGHPVSLMIVRFPPPAATAIRYISFMYRWAASAGQLSQNG